MKYKKIAPHIYVSVKQKLIQLLNKREIVHQFNQLGGWIRYKFYFVDINK